MINKTVITCTALSLLLLTGVNGQNTANAFPKPGAESPATSQDNGIKGTVLETMDGGGYTYMLVEANGSKKWVAVPASKIEVGKEVSYLSGMEMKNFSSKTLGRTFDSIIFSAGLANAAAVKKPANNNSFAQAVKQEAGQPVAQQEPVNSGGSLGAMAPAAEIKIEKAAGENSYTVEEIFSKAKELNGKTVVVKGKIVKYNPNIMGSNWIHIQDGTGDPLNSTHDLVITTSEYPKDNDIITVEGIMSADKDFGAGYKYKAIVEKAKIVN